MKTAFQKLNRTIVTFSIAICSCMPLNVLAQEQQSQIKDPLTVGGLLDVGIGEDDDLYLAKPDCEGHCGGIFVCNSKS